MMRFKNIYTKTCSVNFEGNRYSFNDVTEVDDKKLIEFLKKAPDFICLDKEDSKPNKNEKLEELKKQAKELGIKHNPNIGLEKLEEKINNTLEK